MELRRVAEKEMQASADGDVYMRDYIENIDELLKTTASSSSCNESMTQDT